MTEPTAEKENIPKIPEEEDECWRPPRVGTQEPAAQ